MKKLSTVASIAAILAALSIPAAAQDGGLGSYGDNDFISSDDADEFSVEKMRRMVLEEEGGAAAAPEFVPKNEITIAPKPEVDTSSAKKKESKKDAPPGEKIGNTLGLRFGIGPTWGVALGVGIGLSESGRMDVGMNMGWGDGRHDYSEFIIEAQGFYDLRFKLSDDAALCWYVGPGVAFGWYGTSKDTTVTKVYIDTATGASKPIDSTWTQKPGAFSVGIGFQVGLEVDLQFIDIEHSLSFLRGSSISLDFRPILYPAAWWADKGSDLEHFHSVAWNFGLSFKVGLGGKKGSS
ncbi:MAG: hypothetical protein LBH93_06625 [Chitinispirillales bacterium]|nr:hypothetical protein [Chitinispirillales bacterium]